jgi:hypothetical protein
VAVVAVEEGEVFEEEQQEEEDEEQEEQEEQEVDGVDEAVVVDEVEEGVAVGAEDEPAEADAEADADAEAAPVEEGAEDTLATALAAECASVGEAHACGVVSCCRRLGEERGKSSCAEMAVRSGCSMETPREPPLLASIEVRMAADDEEAEACPDTEAAEVDA